jgi:Circularly permutated YpsA SLOG family
VVFSIGPVLSDASKKTSFLARKLGKPVLHISRDGGPASPDQALLRFFREQHIKVLNVAGPRASKEPKVEEFVARTLRAALVKRLTAEPDFNALVLDDEPAMRDIYCHLLPECRVFATDRSDEALRWRMRCRSIDWRKPAEAAHPALIPPSAVPPIERAADEPRQERLRGQWPSRFPAGA